jgi:C4-dicarboxylate-specific signal transduction histidine kinase
LTVFWEVKGLDPAEDARLKALGALAAGVVHELSSPLSYVNANLRHVVEELARLAPGHPELSEALADALDGASQVADLVADLRVYAYASGDEPAQVDVRATLERVVRLVRPMLHGRTRLFREYEGTPVAWVNEARLGQLFILLLLRAADAASEVGVECATGAGRVTIALGYTGDAPGDLSDARALAQRCGGDVTVEQRAASTVLCAWVPDR